MCNRKPVNEFRCAAFMSSILLSKKNVYQMNSVNNYMMCMFKFKYRILTLRTLNAIKSDIDYARIYIGNLIGVVYIDQII